jgi:cysteinyl-tRNA synthetase
LENLKVTQQVHLTNTLTGKKEVLRPGLQNHVGIYACGVTVYDDCHIGHAMQAIYFDVVRRYLEFAGYNVTYVRNFTDVDDKIINRAKERGLSPAKLADDMIASSNRDMAAIGVKPATHEPRVSRVIEDIVEMVQTLIDNGSAYSTGAGDVYYRVRRKADYGKLSNRKPDELIAGTRSIVQGDKEDELDFALWKADATPDASWPSPWGLGRPGWHIECSAMAKKYLGNTFEIHGGGRDLVFPHHENEIAQSESANNTEYAKHWMHSGLLTINHQKMSKSLGNHISIQEFLKTFTPEVLRLAFLQNHYSSNIDFSKQIFFVCQKRLLYYYETVDLLQKFSNPEQSDAHTPCLTDFHRAMSDDFNTVESVASLNTHMKAAREILQGKRNPNTQKTAAAYLKAFRTIGDVLGLMDQDPQATISDMKRRILPSLGITEDFIEQKIQERKEARQSKNFAQSDAIRSELSLKGIELRDSPEGTLWTISMPADGA